MNDIPYIQENVHLFGLRKKRRKFLQIVENIEYYTGKRLELRLLNEPVFITEIALEQYLKALPLVATPKNNYCGKKKV